MGTSLEDLRNFPTDARHDAGYQLEQVQLGLEPDDWKPMPIVGSGCREIRIRTVDGVFRVFYVTKFGDEVYVLHCFTKKSYKTAQKDIDLGVNRYEQAKKQHQEQKRKGPRP
jgi:phage-related protein